MMELLWFAYYDASVPLYALCKLIRPRGRIASANGANQVNKNVIQDGFPAAGVCGCQVSCFIIILSYNMQLFAKLRSNQKCYMAILDNRDNPRKRCETRAYTGMPHCRYRTVPVPYGISTTQYQNTWLGYDYIIFMYRYILYYTTMT